MNKYRIVREGNYQPRDVNADAYYFSNNFIVFYKNITQQKDLVYSIKHNEVRSIEKINET